MTNEEFEKCRYICAATLKQFEFYLQHDLSDSPLTSADFCGALVSRWLCRYNLPGIDRAVPTVNFQKAIRRWKRTMDVRLADEAEAVNNPTRYARRCEADAKKFILFADELAAEFGDFDAAVPLIEVSLIRATELLGHVPAR